MAKKTETVEKVAPKAKVAKVPKAKKTAEQVPKGKYINPRTDFGFKRIFGTGVFLKNFLNNIFDLKDKIVTLTYQNVEYPGRIEKSRSARFDLNCTTQNGEHIMIEMQNQPHPFFTDRLVYYTTFPVQKQAKKGKWNHKLKKVYSVSIVDFQVFEKDGIYIHKAILYDIEAQRIYNKSLNYITVELADFDKSEDELQTDRDWWVYLLKHLQSLTDIPASLKSNKIFREMMAEAEIANLSPEELDLYDQSLKNYTKMSTKDIIRDYQREFVVFQKEINTLTQSNVTLIQSNAAQSNTIVTLLQSNDALLQSNDALERENAELRRRLALNGSPAKRPATRTTKAKSRKTADVL